MNQSDIVRLDRKVLLDIREDRDDKQSRRRVCRGAELVVTPS